MKRILMGIGNELKGDDGIGNAIAREFKSRKWLSIPCETVPENFTAVVRKHRPEILVIIDACDMNLSPGEFRIIPKDRLDSAIIGTHGIPLKYLVTHLEKYAGKIIFIGVQTGQTGLGERLSPCMEKTKKRLMRIIDRGEWNRIVVFK